MTTTITANDEPTEIEADVDKRFSSIVVNLPVQQTGTGTPSPSNPRPFTMWTDVSLYVSDTEEADEPTLAIELPTPMYGGKVDMVRGEIATTYNSKESGTGWEMTEEGQFRCQVSAYNNGDETSTDVADLYAVHYETVSNKDAYDATDDLTCGLATIAGTTYLYVNDAQYTTLESFATHIADEVFVFRAHIPMSDVTEPHIVYLPAGTSYVWADAGFVDLTVSGAPPLSLPNSLGKPLKAWSVDVLPYQEGTGDPSPSNVRAIHGTDKLTVWTGGANLCDPSTKTRASNTARWYDDTNGYLLKAGVAYTFTTDWSGAVYIMNLSTRTAIVQGNNKVSYTPTNDITVYFQWYNANGGVTEVLAMLTINNSSPTFTPYLAPSQTVLTLPQTVYTGTIGSDGGESRQKKIVLDGSPDEDIATGGYGMTFRFALPNDAKLTVSTTDFANDICNQLVQVKQSTTWGINGTFSRVTNGNNVWFKIDDTITTLEDLRTYLASNPIEYIYELATPQTFPLTAPTIPTPTGSATTWATAEDGTVDSMEVTYVGKA